MKNKGIQTQNKSNAERLAAANKNLNNSIDLTMQQPFTVALLPKAENKCLGYLFMKLEGIPVQPEKSAILALKPTSPPKEQINLYLTLKFDEQRELLLGSRLKFGLKGGELHIRLKNGKMPLASREFEASTDPFPLAGCQMTTKGSEENPSWVFAVEKSADVLSGLVKNVKLGTLDVTAKPCYVEVSFDVLPHHIHLTETVGLWSPTISKKRRAVLERGIARHFFERKLKPYLSQQVLRYD